METDPVFLLVVSDLFVNLSAAWFGAAIVVPLSSRQTKLNYWLLTGNTTSGILALVIAFALRKLVGI